MLTEMIYDLAAQMGVRLTKISFVEGEQLGCQDVSLLKIYVNDHVVSALIYRADIDGIAHHVNRDRLEVRLRSALSRLQLLLAP